MNSTISGAQQYIYEMNRAKQNKSRREKIATAAMQGILCNPTISIEKGISGEDGVALAAVALADALIKELDK